MTHIYRAALLLPFLLAVPAQAQDALPDTGDTAWILTATALVLFMTLPGLALFYGGLVRAKNYVSVLMSVYAQRNFKPDDRHSASGFFVPKPSHRCGDRREV